MSLSAPARWMLICMISLGLQVCCCNVGSAFGDCCGGDEHSQGDSATESESCHEHHEPGGHDDDAGHAPASSHDKKPCTPDQGGNCACGTHDKVPTTVDKTALDFAPALIAILPDEIRLAPVSRLSAEQDQGDRAVFSRRTSLLRQHCALNV